MLTSEKCNLKVLIFIFFWKNWDNSASWILSLPWPLSESHIPHFSNASQWHHFHLLLDSIIQHLYTKAAAGCVFFLLLDSHPFPVRVAFHNTFYLLTMFYQEVWRECTALSNIIVFPEAKPKPPSLCDVLGKPIRFIQKIFVCFYSQVRHCVDWSSHISLTQRSLFLAFASNLFPFSHFVLLHILGKGFLIEGLAGPSCQLSTCGFNYRIGGRWNCEPAHSMASIS